MNTLTTLTTFRQVKNVNTLYYIGIFKQNQSLGVSGTSYVDLSATPLYSTTSMGLNTTNQNNTFTTILNNGNTMRSSDFNSNNFTLYCKYKCRTNTLPVLGRRYPNVVTSDTTNVSVGGNATITFYSSLNPGTQVTYTIRGVLTSDLSNESLSGYFTAPYQRKMYTISNGSGKTITFDMSGTASVNTITIN